MSIDRNSRAARQMRQQSRRKGTGNKNKKRRKKRRFSPWKAVLLTAAVVAAATAGGVAFYLNHLWNLTTDLEVNMEEIQINPNLDVQTEAVQKGFWKIAVFGVDSTDGNLGRGANSDVIIICSVNRETGEIKMASVYRDTYLKVGDKNPYRKINEAYARGGPEQALKALNENLDIAVDDFVAVNWKAVADAINNLGGVDIEVTEAEFRQINGYITSVVENTGVYSQHLKSPGFQHLDGVQAVAYCRLRKMDSDFQRTQRQRAVISQCLEKAKHSDIKVINTVIGICLPQVAHSFRLDDLLEAGRNINKYYLGDTSGFPFDLKLQDIGNLDCVVPVTLTSNVVKLHQFLFNTENYQPSDHVLRISEDIAYNSSKQADSGEELREKDMEKMTSAAKETKGSTGGEKEETSKASEESSKAEGTGEDGTSRQPSAAGEEGSVPEEGQEAGENPNTASDEYVPEDELINDPGLRTTEEPRGTSVESQPSGPRESAGREETRSPEPVQEGPGGSGNSNAGTGGNTGTGPGGAGQEQGSGARVYDTRPVPTESQPTGIEGGPGFFQN